MFFTGWEENQVQVITGARDSGYGHEFEKAFLSFDSNLQESSGHRRIVWYNLGGIGCLVRFEVDGYVDSVLNYDNPASIVNELGQAPSDLQVQNLTNAFVLLPEDRVRVIERGRLVDENIILELKSRSGSLKMQEIISQAWISQISNVFVGRHKD